MTFIDAALRVLSESEGPLNYREVTRRALELGLLNTTGKTPYGSMHARLSEHIARHGGASPFSQVAPGVYALRRGGGIATAEAAEDELEAGEGRATADAIDSALRTPPTRGAGSVAPTFTEAAELVLSEVGRGKPLLVAEIARRAHQKGWIDLPSKTAEAALAAAMLEENRRRRARGEQPLFTAASRRSFGLARWHGEDLLTRVQAHNRRVRRDMRAKLIDLPDEEFETLIVRLLAGIGFVRLTTGRLHQDGAVHLHGEALIAGGVKVAMSVLAGRWLDYAPPSVIRELRRNLAPGEIGLAITTGDFSPEAVAEAGRGGVAISLMAGTDLLDLFIANGLVARRERVDVLEIAD
jgi:hypothetical protein